MTVSAVYSDEAVSGADTKRLVQRERLLTAIRGGAAPFDVLVMRDTSRFSRRDGDEAFTELKQVAQGWTSGFMRTRPNSPLGTSPATSPG